MDIFTKFYNIPSKDKQDLFLQGLIDAVEVQQRRPSVKEGVVPKGLKCAAFSYHVILGAARKEVCLKAFLSIFAVSEKRVRRIRQLKMEGRLPEDKRGKSISNTLPPETHQLVDEHIRKFPLKMSHYCGKTSYYLSSDLTLKKNV